MTFGGVVAIIIVLIVLLNVVALAVRLAPVKPQVPQFPPPLVPPVQPQEPLAPGSLMRATIEPFPNNIIRVFIQLSEEARTIFDKQNIWGRMLFDYPNPHYEVQIRAYEKAWETYKSQARSSSQGTRDIAKAPIDPEPLKQFPITVAQFCSAAGLVREFPTAGEAKEWAAELRTHIDNLKKIIEQNKAPPEKETFEL
jgi:hypothetical protein